MTSTLILGGARSGKSQRAQMLTEAESPTCTFIATAEALDAEMAERIEHHRTQRGQVWVTIESPLELPSAIRQAARDTRPILVDCLTLWLSNLMHNHRDIDLETKQLLESIDEIDNHIIFVSNEVGLGLVPDTPLGRAFRDAQGRLNQAVAAACDRVEFVVAGLPITLKG